MLKSIFISHHFDPPAIELADAVARLVRSHNLKPITGRRLMGEPLSIGVKRKMKSCQATIVLLTNRDEGRTNTILYFSSYKLTAYDQIEQHQEILPCWGKFSTSIKRDRS